MMPLLQGQIDVGEFVYDGTLPAMRATVYGLQSGAVDLLITDKDTYVLSGRHRSPTRCTSLGHKLDVPSAQWLSDQSVCVGEARLGTEPVQWWKTPGSNGHAKRYWTSARTRLPWRSLFVSRAADPAVIGDYAMTYFAEFAPLAETGLASLRDMCSRRAEPSKAEDIPDEPTARDLMTLRNEAAEAERLQRISNLVPGLSHAACSRMTPARWPDRYVMAAILTPIQFKEGTYSSLIYYDWQDAESQLVEMYHGNPPVLHGAVSLKKGVGYRIRLPASGHAAACDAVLPGVVRPDWMSAAWCECKGVIERGSPLSPEAESQILSCPIKWQGKRVMWNWYTSKGRPIMFVEAAPQGGGLMLADYHDWRPGETARPADFALPATCNAAAGSPGGAKPTYSNASCSDCHTTP